MTDIQQSRAALLARLVEGDGVARRDERRAAFTGGGLDGSLGALLDKVRLAATRVTDADVAAAKAAGLSEDQIFELVIAAAVGQAAKQYDAANAALAAATTGE